jgi:hypothetical protein
MQTVHKSYSANLLCTYTQQRSMHTQRSMDTHMRCWRCAHLMQGHCPDTCNSAAPAASSASTLRVCETGTRMHYMLNQLNSVNTPYTIHHHFEQPRLVLAYTAHSICASTINHVHGSCCACLASSAAALHHKYRARTLRCSLLLTQQPQA